MTERSEVESVFPDGPALIYVPTKDELGIGTTIAFRVDRGVPLQAGGSLSDGDARRERAILRALLTHALHLVDQADSEVQR